MCVHYFQGVLTVHVHAYVCIHVCLYVCVCVCMCVCMLCLQDLSSLRQEVQRLRQENRLLESRAHELEKSLHSLTTRTAVQEQEIKDKEEVCIDRTFSIPHAHTYIPIRMQVHACASVLLCSECTYAIHRVPSRVVLYCSISPDISYTLHS